MSEDFKRQGKRTNRNGKERTKVFSIGRKTLAGALGVISPLNYIKGQRSSHLWRVRNDRGKTCPQNRGEDR